MTRTTGARTAAASLILLAAAFAGAVTAVETSSAAPAASEQPRRTSLTFTVDDCEGCKLQLEQGIATDDPQRSRVWHSRWKKVEGGEVTFDVRSSRTFGAAVLVKAPWEGHAGYTTTVAMRYAGNDVGDRVTLRSARSERRASACWEGTRQAELTLPLVVREVQVRGVQERVPGAIAFAKETESWLGAARRAPRGVLGSQDVNLCR